MLSTCGSGLAPPNGMVKLSGFTWLKTFGPTTTHTGTVAVSPVVTNTNWPQKVPATSPPGSEEHTSELQSPCNLVCRLLLEKKKQDNPPKPERHETNLERSQRLMPSQFLENGRREFQRQHRVVERLAFLFFNDPATPEIYPLSLHDALPISASLPHARPLPPSGRHSNRQELPEVPD